MSGEYTLIESTVKCKNDNYFHDQVCIRLRDCLPAALRHAARRQERGRHQELLSGAEFV